MSQIIKWFICLLYDHDWTVEESIKNGIQRNIRTCDRCDKTQASYRPKGIWSPWHDAKKRIKV